MVNAGGVMLVICVWILTRYNRVVHSFFLIQWLCQPMLRARIAMAECMKVVRSRQALLKA